VKAIGYWDPENPWEPESMNGQHVVWDWGPMWSDATWTFDLVVQIDADALPGLELLNLIEVWGDNPYEIDINPANNYFEYPLQLPLLRILMPLTQRTP
jgi:hypothetical protein